MKEIDVEKVLAMRAKSGAKLANSELNMHRVLGEYVTQVITTHGEVSIALLKAAIELSINHSPSVKGEQCPDQDMQRIVDEAVLKRLNELIAR